MNHWHRREEAEDDNRPTDGFYGTVLRRPVPLLLNFASVDGLHPLSETVLLEEDEPDLIFGSATHKFILEVPERV